MVSLPFNLSLKSNVTSTLVNRTLPILGNISTLFSYKSIPSLFTFLIVLILVFAIIKVVLKMTGTIEEFLSKYLPILSLFIGMTIYIPIYSAQLPHMFTVKTFDPDVNKTITVADQKVINDIMQYRYVPPAFWDRVIYYGVQKGFSEDELFIPFIMLFALFLYLTFVTFSKYIPFGSPFFSLLALLLLTGGGLGILAILANWNTYTTYVLLLILAFVAYYTYYIFKKLFE